MLLVYLMIKQSYLKKWVTFVCLRESRAFFIDIFFNFLNNIRHDKSASSRNSYHPTCSTVARKVNVRKNTTPMDKNKRDYDWDYGRNRRTNECVTNNRGFTVYVIFPSSIPSSVHADRKHLYFIRISLRFHPSPISYADGQKTASYCDSYII